MKVTNTYYSNKEILKSFIESEGIDDSPSLLIQVFSAFNDEAFIHTLLKELDALLPQAVLIGSTTDGEIMNGKVSSDKVVLSFAQFEHTSLKVAAIEHKADGRCSGEYLAEKIVGDDTKLVIAFADGLHTNGDSFLKGLSLNNEVMIAGGHAGDSFKFEKTLIFTKEKILHKGAVAVSLNSKILQVQNDYSFHWHPIGNELTITRAEGNRVYTIDGKKAEDIYAKYLGKEIAKGLPAIGIEFPLIVTRNGLDIARAAMSKESDGSLIVAGTLKSGEKVRIGFGDSPEIISASRRSLKFISQHPSEAIFIYSCTARKHFMGQGIEAETLPFQALAPVSGFFTYGEFFSSGKNELLNQSMTLVSLSESSEIQHTLSEIENLETDVNSASLKGLLHLIDITSKELREQTDTLKESNRLNSILKERMELALLGSKTSVLDWDFSTNTLYISPSWKEMLGFKDDELENSTHTWKQRAHPEDRLAVIRLLRRYQRSKRVYFESTHRLKHRNGQWIWVLGRAKILYDEKGNKVRMIGTHTDITEEKELQLKYFYQSEMINQIHDSVTTTDLEGKIVSWNKGSELTFGYTAEEAIGQPIDMLYREVDKPMLRDYVTELMRTGTYNADLLLLTKEKKTIPISFSLSLLRDEEGKPMGVVGINKDNTRRKAAEDALLEQKEKFHYQAHHDTLTGLPNRALFTQRLNGCIEMARRENMWFALFFIDLDKFKDINDSLGHEIGDRVLKMIANRLKSIIREEDTLARLSGDEFTIIMRDLHQIDDVSVMAEKILDILEEPVHIDEDVLYVSGSIGISLYPKDAENAEYLLKYADTAMYIAKEDGRNTYRFYSKEMTESAKDHMGLKTSLRQALDNSDFLIYYQPQIDTVTDRVTGLEALIRWEHPLKGLLSPSKFIPVAEETGLIIDIDRWMMSTAMKQVSEWYAQGLNPGKLALNLSIKQLERNHFVHEVKQNLEAFNFKAEWLELEITEGQMMKNPEDAIAKLKEISDLGIGISIDDFGTGYSSLSLLKRLPINRLKIDRSFVGDIPNDTDDISIIQAIIALGKSLNLELIAEGVETEEQKVFLQENGCPDMQGHYFSYPLPQEEITQKLEELRG